MVSLLDVQSSNAKIPKELPANLVAVFVGATNGIGEAALKEFARSARSPRAYFIGRSQEAAARITAECRQLNPEGDFIFIKADVSLIRNVDDVCRELKNKESTINILFLSCGTVAYGEGIYIARFHPAAFTLQVSRFYVNTDSQTHPKACT
jgi:short-subunit dehydrogenase